MCPYEENERFVQEHARQLAYAIGAAKQLEYHRRILELRNVSWLLFGDSCPQCGRCAGGTLFPNGGTCERCELVAEIWVQLSAQSKRRMAEYLTLKTVAENAEARPAEQFE